MSNKKDMPSKEELIAEGYKFILTEEAIKELYGNMSYPVKYTKNQYIGDKYEYEYICPFCGKSDSYSSTKQNAEITCSCGTKLYLGYRYCPDSLLDNVYRQSLNGDADAHHYNVFAVPVDNGILKGAIIFDADLSLKYVDNKYVLNIKIVEDDYIVYCGINEMCIYHPDGNKIRRKLRTLYIGSKHNYNSNSYVFKKVSDVFNKNDIKYLRHFDDYYLGVKKTLIKITPKSSFPAEDAKYKKYLIDKKVNEWENIFLYNIVKTDYINSTCAYDVYCPGCHNHFQLTDIKTSERYRVEMKCPVCGKEAGEKRERGCMDYDRYCAEISVENDEIILMRRLLEKNRVVATDDKCECTYHCPEKIYTISLSPENLGQVKKYTVESGKIIGCTKNASAGKKEYVEKIIYLSEDKRLLYTGIKKFDDTKLYMIVKYLSLAVKYKIIEKLINADMGWLVNRILEVDDPVNYCTDYCFEADKVSEFLKAPEYLFKIWHKHLGNVNQLKDLQKINELTGVNTIDEKDIKYLEKNKLEGLLSPMVIIAELTRTTFSEQLSYLERVRVNQCIIPEQALVFWKDYLYSADKIGVDVKDKSVKFPVSLKREHDIITYKASLITNDKQKEAFETRTSEYGSKFEWDIKSEDYLVSYPKTISELFEEGRKLNHCVGNYADNIVSGQDMILFIRNKETPDVPYYTMNVRPDSNDVVEISSYSNKQLHKKEEPELYEFLKKWCERKKVSGLNRCVS